jgi:hypothetical protein
MRRLLQSARTNNPPQLRYCGVDLATNKRSRAPGAPGYLLRQDFTNSVNSGQALPASLEASVLQSRVAVDMERRRVKEKYIGQSWKISAYFFSRIDASPGKV